MLKAFSASAVFDGASFHSNLAIIVEGDSIVQILPGEKLPGNIAHHFYENCMILPAFIDIQVYGAQSRLFSLFPSVETLQLMAEKFLQSGTGLFQPTVATNAMGVIKKCIDAVRLYKSTGNNAVHGLHIEGPWINPLKKGAHLEEYIHPPTGEEVKDLLEYGKGIITMITLAPEICKKPIIDLILSYDVKISAGHSNASYAQSMQAFNGGVVAVTHLFNAMSNFHHREPGMPGAAFLHPAVKASIIPDGYHVDFHAVAIAKKILGERLFAITDAVTVTVDGPYQHILNTDHYVCNGTLSGSALSMYDAFFNLVTHAGIEKGEANRMCSLYPAQVLGLENRYGKIAPGYAGQFLVIDKQLKLVEVIT